MIKYVKGSLFDSNSDILAHGCNCLGGYGAGIAAQISKLYPESRDLYLKKHKEEGWKLGEVQFVVSQGKIIANCATQQNYGGGAKYGKVYVSYDAIQTVMEKLHKKSVEENLSVSIPKIGAGLAGGDWTRIESIINSIFIDKEITVYYL